MPRCALPAARRRLLRALPLLALMTLGLSPSWAQLPRNFPANALRGVIRFTQPPEIELNGETVRLAPGARIRGADNMMKLPASLTGQRVTVNYTLETFTGTVLDVWILRDDEAAKRPWPMTLEQARSWTFDAAAQTWTQP